MKGQAEEDAVREAALEEVCDTCAAQPGEQCRRTKGQLVHYPRRAAGARALGLNVEARPRWH